MTGLLAYSSIQHYELVLLSLNCTSVDINFLNYKLRCQRLYALPFPVTDAIYRNLESTPRGLMSGFFSVP
jgi:hypothetical protein